MVWKLLECVVTSQFCSFQVLVSVSHPIIEFVVGILVPLNVGVDPILVGILDTLMSVSLLFGVYLVGVWAWYVLVVSVLLTPLILQFFAWPCLPPQSFRLFRSCVSAPPKLPSNPQTFLLLASQCPCSSTCLLSLDCLVTFIYLL